MTDARLVWITREQDAEPGEMIDGSEILNELIPLIEIRCAFDAAPEPVKRRRCETHDCSEVNDYANSVYEVRRCWKGEKYEEVRSCRFVTVWEVPDV
jgi:hypothetical protein